MRTPKLFVCSRGDTNGALVAEFPITALRRIGRAAASLESLVARWTLAHPIGARVEKLVGAPSRLRVANVIESPAGSPSVSSFDPFAALVEVRVHGQSFTVAGSSGFVRELAQKRLYGPDELAAPRPLALAEHAVFAGVVAAALADARVPGDVWPVVDLERSRARLNSPMSAPGLPASARMSFVVELALEIDGRAPLAILVWCPHGLRVVPPPPRALPRWELDLPVILGSCALHRDDVRRLHLRDVITIERQLGLVVGDGVIALSAAPGAVEARVASDYVRRDMALPDDAHLELTVQLGTTRLSLRQLSDLVPGSIVPLGRPLSGPFEVRVAGRLVGQGELVDVDGELGVRIVSLQE